MYLVTEMFTLQFSLTYYHGAPCLLTWYQYLLYLSMGCLYQPSSSCSRSHCCASLTSLREQERSFSLCELLTAGRRNRIHRSVTLLVCLKLNSRA